MAEHELKTWPEYFEQVVSGAKPFEVRKADRPFAVGDVLWLREYDPDTDRHTGRDCRRRVTYVLPGGAFGIAHGFAVLGLDQDAAHAKGYDLAREQAAKKADDAAESCERAVSREKGRQRPSQTVINEGLVVQVAMDALAASIRAMRPEGSET